MSKTIMETVYPILGFEFVHATVHLKCSRNCYASDSR